MKILHILVLPQLAGAQRVSLETLKNLSNDEYEKSVLFSNDVIDNDVKIKCISEFEKAGAKILFSKYMYRKIGIKDIAAVIEIYKLCRKERYSIVHTNSSKPGVIGRIAATLAHTSLVIHTVHGLAFHRYMKLQKWLLYWAYEMFASLFCHKIVLVNKYYSKYFKLFKSKILTIYNGLDFMMYSDTKAIYNETMVKILFVGRLDEQKDPITLLQAAKEVLKDESEVIFTLVGDGEKYNDCELFIKDNNLENNVCLAGWQSDMSRYYKSHHIFITSSIYEAFGLVFLEAGYYKLPVVATNVEGVPEVV
jgi:glycosyltransferase involved in cell wall biosynthesis